MTKVVIYSVIELCLELGGIQRTIRLDCSFLTLSYNFALVVSFDLNIFYLFPNQSHGVQKTALFSLLPQMVTPLYLHIVLCQVFFCPVCLAYQHDANSGSRT